MGNKALIPRSSDPYDSGIDSDEGKTSLTNAVFTRDRETNNVFMNTYEYDKIERKPQDDELQKSLWRKQSNSADTNGYIKWNFKEDYKNEHPELNRPLIDSFKHQEQLRMTNLSPNGTEAWNTNTDSDNDSSPLYEVELTASDEDDSSVLELVIPIQSHKTTPRHWLLVFFCFGCMERYA
ncbi:unnamed protein product [Leptosia nina]|uniref:Uncharacterized protein n=1 Tax=Leptosia nina TaxID=320188 RepID=A0AAV1JQ47_9NEOP